MRSVCRSKTSSIVLRSSASRLRVAERPASMRRVTNSCQSSGRSPRSMGSSSWAWYVWASASSPASSSSSSGERPFSPRRVMLSLENVDLLGDHLAAGEVLGLRLGVAPDDVGLVLLELPRLHDDEVALADPHAALHLARDAGEARKAVLAHHVQARAADQLF